MGKYLFIMAVLGVYIYSYMAMPKDIQAATQLEIVRLHNPLMPLPDTVAVQENSASAIESDSAVESDAIEVDSDSEINQTDFILVSSPSAANSSY